MKAPVRPSLGAFAQRALESGWFDLAMRWRAADIARKSRLGEHLPASGLVLDLGSGLGHMAEAALGEQDCIAVDPVWLPPRLLAQRVGSRVRPVRADGTALPFAAGAFDGGWCAFVLHHLPPAAQDQMLAEVARVLRQGASFVLIEDTPVCSATLRADRRLNFEDDAAPHHYRSPDAWRDALSARGLHPVTEIAFSAVFPRATWRRVPHRAFVCRRS